MKQRIWLMLLACPLFGQMPDWISQIRNKPFIDARTYQFTRTNGLGASGDLSTPGAGKVVTLTPCPFGVAGNSPYLWLFVGGGTEGTSTQEAVKVTGGTCTSGAASGAVIFATVGIHTGAWSVTSATSGIQEAIYASELPREIYIPHCIAGCVTNNNMWPIYAPIKIPNVLGYSGQWSIRGEGRYDTSLFISGTMPLAERGVFIVGDTGVLAEPAPIFSDFNMFFGQPSTAPFVPFPPAIECAGCRHLEVRNVAITRAWNGIRLKGSWNGSAWATTVGQIKITNVEMSAFNIGIDLDGVLDVIDIDNFNYWPFYALSLDQAAAFNNSLAMKLGRIDGFQMKSGLFFNDNAMEFGFGADGGIVFGSVVGTRFDERASVSLLGGNVRFDSTYHTMGPTCTEPAVEHSGGDFSFNNAWFLKNCPQNAIHSNSANISFLSITNSMFNHNNMTAATPADIRVENGQGQYLIGNNQFFRNGSVAWTVPVVQCVSSAARCTITDNRINGTAGGSGTLISVDTAGFHVVKNNMGPGWGISVPSDTSNGRYENEQWEALRPLFLSPMTLSPLTFANLGTPSNGAVAYCSDCSLTSVSDNTCAAGGSGTLAVRLSGAWRCFANQN